LAQPLLDAGSEALLTPVIQGFVGQRSFLVQKSRSDQKDSTCVVALDPSQQESDSISHITAHATEALPKPTSDTTNFLLTLISRRSTKRSGLRYLRRGIDDEGNCANTVETEQILSDPNWSQSRPLRSFLQIRASIPLYFSQSPYSFKPVPVIHQSQDSNNKALEKHFKFLSNRYGEVQAVLLVNKHGNEVAIGQAYEKNMERLVEAGQLQKVSLEWFDFHAECRGMKFENVDRLVQKLKPEITRHGETLFLDGNCKKRQAGIIRTNCMDCLDRTNVAESAFGQYMLQAALEEEGFTIDLVHDQGTTWFNTLWADNGDAISRQYAGTAALKGDFTSMFNQEPYSDVLMRDTYRNAETRLSWSFE
jgi:SacI homology domain